MRILTVLLLIAPVVSAQPPQKTGCALDGFVVNSVTGEPVMRARVSVLSGAISISVQTTPSGAWSASGVTCGMAVVNAVKNGFLSGKTTEVRVPLASDSPAHGVRIRLAPQAVVTGKVTDDAGEPIPNAEVTVLTPRVVYGLRSWIARPFDKATTNDLGEFRIAGLAAGKYIFCARTDNRGLLLAREEQKPYGDQCFPGPMESGKGGGMEVAAGYEGRIGFILTALSSAHVRGSVSGVSEGSGGHNLEVRRMVAGLPTEMLLAAVKNDGTFDIPNLAPGSYTLTTYAGQQGKQLRAQATVEVGATDIDGIQLHLEPEVRVTGNVRIMSATGNRIAKPQYTVALWHNDGVWGQAT